MSYLCKTMAACLAFAGLSMAQIQPVLTGEEGQGNVDWSKRTIVATGIGAPNPNLPESAQRPGAMRAAQQIALRNALETVKGIFLNSSTTVENFMTTSDVVSSRVSGFIKGFEQKGRTKYMSDGTVEITMEIPLDGFGMSVMDEEIGATPRLTAFEGDKAKKEAVFSGLIIDCRGLGVKPALSPKVLDEDGREIYGSAFISKEWAVKYGVVGYSKDVAAAAKLDRIGKTPGQIKAAKAAGQNSTDVVISNTDAADVRSAAQNLKFLSECRVVFIVD